MRDSSGCRIRSSVTAAWTRMRTSLWTARTMMTEGPDPPTPSPCGQGEARPNLVPISWSASYNSQPGGTGTWQYRVSNTGRATAATGVNVNLILSTDQVADSSDHWVTWEEIPFELGPGISAVRDADNPLSFRVPETIPAGTYYMALWVDDVNEVRECNETDNVSLGRDQVQFRSNLPDIAIESWWTRWFTGTGKRSIAVPCHQQGHGSDYGYHLGHQIWSYTRCRIRPTGRGEGTSCSMKMRPTCCGRTNRYTATPQIRPASICTGNQFGNTVPSDTYYISLWVDGRGRVRESNELEQPIHRDQPSHHRRSRSLERAAVRCRESNR